MSKVRCANKNCKKYIEKESAVRRGMVSYCSDECLYQRPQAKRKTSTSKARKRVTKKSRATESLYEPEQILERDKHCRLCGQSYGLAVHHIFYRSDQLNKPWQNEPWNLLTLCNDHHLNVIHANKKYWQPICLAYTWFLEVEGKQYMLPELEEMIHQVT